jgi:hypothetical protein
MKKGDGVPNESLLAAALELMKQNGKPLTKSGGFGRSMRYSLANGESVRVRTCNDHILIVLGDQPSGEAKLNIDGTDWLLVAMPEVPRTPGKVAVYLVPTKDAVAAARSTHQAWLDTSPNTKGSNNTWNLWFDDDGPAKANGFAKKWAQFRLPGEAETSQAVDLESDGSVKSEVEIARQRISKAAGISPSAVRITLDFGL